MKRSSQRPKIEEHNSCMVGKLEVCKVVKDRGTQKRNLRMDANVGLFDEQVTHPKLDTSEEQKLIPRVSVHLK